MAGLRSAIDRRRWRRTVVVQLAMVLTVAGLFLITGVQQWRSAGDRLGTVADQRHGIGYLRPLTKLLGTLTEAQATAVRGGQVQTISIKSVVGEVDKADRAYGAELGTRKRWADTRLAVTEVAATRPAGSAAFEQYGEAASLVRQLGLRIADSAGLVVNDHVDSSYLIDAALMRLPDIIIGAGRAADLSVIDVAAAGQESQAQTRISVARYNVAVGAEAVGIDLAKSLDSTSSPTLGPNITNQLDAFRSAVDSFVPSGTRLRGIERGETASLSRTAILVRQSALPLAEAVYNELDKLLADREQALGWQRLRAAGIPFLGLLVALVLTWMLIPAPRTGADESVDVDVRAAGGSSADQEPRARPGTAVIDPRDLMAVEELVHAGRAIRIRRGERDHDAG